MEQKNVDLDPITKRSKSLAVKKYNSKRSFSFIVNSTKNDPLTQASRVTLLYVINSVFCKIFIPN